MNKKEPSRKKLSWIDSPLSGCNDGLHEWREMWIYSVSGSHFIVYECDDCGLEDEKSISPEIYDEYLGILPYCEDT